MLSIYLASNSPRRRQLLTQLNLKFAYITNDINERINSNETVDLYVQHMALEKAKVGLILAKYPLPILGADTVVVLDNQLFAKPRDLLEAANMLEKLSGRTHRVMTAIAMLDKQYQLTKLVSTEITFRKLSMEEIAAYVASGESMDKAGAWAIQGEGRRFVSRINGSYHAVIGLPLVETLSLFNQIQTLRSSRSYDEC